MHIEHDHDDPPAKESWTDILRIIVNRYAEPVMFLYGRTVREVTAQLRVGGYLLPGVNLTSVLGI